MSTPNQLHVIADIAPGLGVVSPMMHSYGNGQGQWQGFFGNVNQVLDDSTLSFSSLLACTGVASSLHVCGIATDNNIYHSIRYQGGNWQGFFGNVNGQNQGAPESGFMDVGCTGAQSSGDVHVCATGVPSGTGQGTIIYHTYRRADGSWQGFFGNVNAQNGSDTPSFNFVACTTIGETLHVIGLDTTGVPWYTYRNADGSWQGSFTNLGNNPPGLPPGQDVACTSIDTTLHVCISSKAGGTIYHTSLPSGGSWQPSDSAPLPSGATFMRSSIGCANVNGVLHVAGIAPQSGNNAAIVHITRDASGNWILPYENISQANNYTALAYYLDIAGVV